MKPVSAVEDLAGFFSMQWVEVFSALLTPTIACLGLYIAFQQWSVNRANLREKLFERRFLVFKETQNFLSEISAKKETSNKSVRKFLDTCQRSRFLYGKNIADYLFEVSTHARYMKTHRAEYQDMEEEGEDRRRLEEKERKELEWLKRQLPIIFDKFEPFLGFEKHR